MRPSAHKKTAAPLVAAALALFAVFNVLAFRAGIYHAVLDPDSSTGSFESAIAHFRRFRSDPRRDVLVLGDSRIYSGLDPQAASSAAGGGLRFLNAGVPGTTPRCWPFFLRAIDPRADRFRAVVVAVDTYADDDSAIGSLDGDDRPMDLRYIVFQTKLADLPKLAGSFSDPRERVENGIDLFLRGQELRADFQALLADPLGRLRGIATAAAAPAFDPMGAHPRFETLRGLRVNFARNAMEYPPGIDAGEQDAIATQVLKIPQVSPSYAKYRRQWLDPIAARYAAAGRPVIFVRIPTRPAPRYDVQAPSGSLLWIERARHAYLIPARAYMALERPEFFADEDHLNRQGSRLFSRLLGFDIARSLAPPRGAHARHPERSRATRGYPAPAPRA